MKDVAELRSLTTKQIYEELLDTQKEQFKLKMQSHRSGEFKQWSLLKTTRCQIARIKTVIREKELTNE